MDIIKNTKTEEEARSIILEMVSDYAKKYHLKHDEYKEGDRIPYAARVYDEKEMVNLVDSSLEFWLSAGRYTEKFEKDFGNILELST